MTYVLPFLMRIVASCGRAEDAEASQLCVGEENVERFWFRLGTVNQFVI